MARNASFTPKEDKTRKTSPWKVEIPPKYSENGNRQQRFFATKALAEGEIQRLKVRKENHGTAAKLLTPADEQQAASVFKLIREKGITLQLSEIVGDYITRWERRNASVTLSHAWEEYLKLMERNQRSAVHIKNLKCTRDRFSVIHHKIVADLTAGDIEKGLEGAAPSYRNALLREIRAILNYAKGRKWLTSNPAEDCEVIRRKLGEVAIYSPEEIKVLLETTVTLHPELVPAVALMTFAGIRPDHLDGEITKIEWNHLVLKDRQRNGLSFRHPLQRQGNAAPSLFAPPSPLGWRGIKTAPKATTTLARGLFAR